MPLANKNLAILIGGNFQNYIHWLAMFQTLRQVYCWPIQYIFWEAEMADQARSVVDIDSVHLLAASLFQFSDYPRLRKILQDYNIDIIIEMGSIPVWIKWQIKKQKVFQKILVSEQVDLKDKEYTDYRLLVYPAHTAKLYFQQKQAFLVWPQVNYQDFLDLDTQRVLNIKQDLNLVHYQEQVIYREFVIGYVAYKARQLSQALESWDILCYNLVTGGSNFKLPAELKSNIPVLYELLDCLIMMDEYNSKFDSPIIAAMASGTILIVPRSPDYQAFLGKGALYYKLNSASELLACIDILRKSESKKKEIRDYATHQFQKKYSYQAIAQTWNQILSKL